MPGLMPELVEAQVRHGGNVAPFGRENIPFGWSRLSFQGAMLGS
jgi:hypothetical protein